MPVFLSLALLIAATLPNPIKAGELGAFQELQNLQTLGAQSRQSGLPIVLMFGAEWCEFCQVLTAAVFSPMAMSGDYEGKVAYLRHVGVDEPERIRGFEGEWLKKSQWAYQLDADLTPTTLFLDGHGREVAQRIVGISTLEMYAGLIHDRLNQAYKAMGNPLRIPVTPEKYQQQLRRQRITH